MTADTDDDPLGAFLGRVQDLSAEQFARVREAGRALTPAPRIAARKAAKLSAAEFAAVERRVREAIQPLDTRLGVSADGALSAAVNDALLAAHGVVARRTLTPEQYDVLVSPFVAVGVEVPGHDA